MGFTSSFTGSRLGNGATICRIRTLRIHRHGLPRVGRSFFGVVRITSRTRFHGRVDRNVGDGGRHRTRTTVHRRTILGLDNLISFRLPRITVRHTARSVFTRFIGRRVRVNVGTSSLLTGHSRIRNRTGRTTGAHIGTRVLLNTVTSTRGIRIGRRSLTRRMAHRTCTAKRGPRGLIGRLSGSHTHLTRLHRSIHYSGTLALIISTTGGTWTFTLGHGGTFP